MLYNYKTNMSPRVSTKRVSAKQIKFAITENVFNRLLLFQGEWKNAITREDLFDMNFIRFPSAERRLVKTVGINKLMTMMAGYSELVDVTAAEVKDFMCYLLLISNY